MIVGERITLPQVHTWQVYLAKQPNFLGLQKGDKINFDDYELVAKIDGEYPPFQVAQNIEDSWIDNDTTLEVYGDNQNGCRSLSVSDIVCNTITGQCYIVNNIGYHLLESGDSKSAETFEAQVDNNDRFLVDITCPWCNEPYDGTEVLDDYEGQIVHYRCAASDNYKAESNIKTFKCGLCWAELPVNLLMSGDLVADKFGMGVAHMCHPCYYRVDIDESDELIDYNFKIPQYQKSWSESCSICGEDPDHICFEAQEYGNNCYDCGGFLKDCIGYVNGEPCNQAGIGTRLCSKCGDGPRCDSCRKIYDYYGGDDPICEVCYQMVPYNPISNVGESHKRWCKWDAGAGQTAGTCETCWSEPWMWSNDLGYIFFDEDSPYYNSDYERMCLHCMEEDFPEIYEHLVNQPVKVEPTSKKRWQFWKSENFEAPSYGSYYGACLLPDGSCTETSLDMCRALGGRFQGPGTSCYPDDNYLKPRIMRSESSNQLGKGFLITVVAGAVSGLVAAVFGTVISEIILDRLREDPELEITDENPETNTP